MGKVIHLRAGDRAELDSVYGDSVTLWSSTDPDDDVLYLGVIDSDRESNATAALDPDVASRIGIELIYAARSKRGQRRA